MKKILKDMKEVFKYKESRNMYIFINILILGVTNFVYFTSTSTLTPEIMYNLYFILGVNIGSIIISNTFLYLIIDNR